MSKTDETLKTALAAESLARNRYSFSAENLSKVDAIEIKIGQSAKPGLMGHLPGNKVTSEIARIR